MPFLLLVKSHALFPNSEKYVVEIRLSRYIAFTAIANKHFGTPVFCGTLISN